MRFLRRARTSYSPVIADHHYYLNFQQADTPPDHALVPTMAAVKICSMKKYKLESELERFTARGDWQCPMPEDVPTIYIHGKMLNNDSSASYLSVLQGSESRRCSARSTPSF